MEPFNTNIYPDIHPHLNVAQIQVVKNSVGPGKRFCIWLQGCQKRCPGCINQDFLAIKPALVTPVESLIIKINETKKEGIEGITLTGGEPILQAEALLPLLKEIRTHGFSVVCYTGFEYGELKKSKQPAIEQLLGLIDLLIDGPYLKDLPRGGPYCSGSNQKTRFLTNRYSPQDLIDRPETVITLGKDKVEFTGILGNDLMSKIRDKLKKHGVDMQGES